MSGTQPGQGSPDQLKVGTQGCTVSTCDMGTVWVLSFTIVCLINTVGLEDIVRCVTSGRLGSMPPSTLGQLRGRQTRNRVQCLLVAQAGGLVAPVSLVTRVLLSTV